MFQDLIKIFCSFAGLFAKLHQSEERERERWPFLVFESICLLPVTTYLTTQR